MTSIPYDFFVNAQGGATLHSTHTTLFLKAAGIPSSDTAVFDADFGVDGYLRLKLTTSLHLIAEASMLGGVTTLDINAGTAILAGTWYWIDVFILPCDAPSGRTVRLAGQVTSPGGVSVGVQAATLVNSFGTGGLLITLNARFSVGKTTSTSLADWPNTTGWEWSKVCLRQVPTVFFSFSGVDMPTTDYGVDSNIIAYWKCRDVVGAESVLVDSSGNGYSLTGTFTIDADGPYA